jgi:hypothetical protein
MMAHAFMQRDYHEINEIHGKNDISVRTLQTPSNSNKFLKWLRTPERCEIQCHKTELERSDLRVHHRAKAVSNMLRE